MGNAFRFRSFSEENCLHNKSKAVSLCVHRLGEFFAVLIMSVIQSIRSVENRVPFDINLLVLVVSEDNQLKRDFDTAIF